MKKLILGLVSLVLMLGMVGAVSATDLLPVVVNSLGRPTLQGTIATDGTSIIFGIRAVGQADDGDDTNPSKYYSQTNFDNEYFTISAVGKFLKYNMWGGNTTPYWGTSWGDATNPLPAGVTFSQTQDGDDFVYAVSMSYAVLGVIEGGTFPVQIKARDFNDDYVQSYTGYEGFVGLWSQYRGLWVTDTGVFDVTIPTPMVPMASFVIEHAKLDFKKKPDDDKIHVKGRFELAPESNGVDISEDVIVTIGLFKETIGMWTKGKKEDKWEYKRPKGESGIKHMKIDWKEKKKKGNQVEFDIHVDKAALGEMSDWTNPVTISIQIGDDLGSESILMTEKKHHWDYKAKKVKSLEASGAEESIVQTESGLYQNYPNPFNPTTTIEYSLAEGCDVILKIYSLSGKLIRTLVNEYQSAGYYSITWYGDNEVGQEIASGVYFYRIKAGDLVSTKKMVVLK